MIPAKHQRLSDNVSAEYGTKIPRVFDKKLGSGIDCGNQWGENGQQATNLSLRKLKSTPLSPLSDLIFMLARIYIYDHDHI